MMSEKELMKTSKFLSLVLRHQPEVIGLQLDENGWASVAELLQKAQMKGFVLDHTTLEHLVQTNNKKRFAFSEDCTMIRASQGHSIDVDLGYTAAVPPGILFHGTAEKSLVAILGQGLVKQNRHHVHLSTDRETAQKVGQRHGKPIVLTVAAERMHQDGFQFFVSVNGVWLTDHVPPSYLETP